VGKETKMIRYIFLFSCVTLLCLSAGNYDDFKKYLQNEAFGEACKSGKKLVFDDGVNDENEISKIALSCLKADYINILGSLQIKLRKSKEARVNAVILSSILLQKRLIYQAIFDDVDISSISLPVIDHPLSHTFIALRDKNYKVLSHTPKVIAFNAGEKSYRVFIEESKKSRIVIEVKDKNNNIEEHKYR
jgi:hypothetical protein